MPPLFTRTFWTLLGGQFLQNLSFASLPLVPLLLLQLGASRTETGLIMAAGGVGAVLCRPLVGWALDAIGRRVVVYVSTLLTAAAMVWLAFIPSVGPALFLNRIVFGMAMGASATAWFTLAIDGMPLARRTEGIALFGLAGLLGLIVNPIAGELGLDGASIRSVFPWLGLVVALSLIAVVLASPDRQTRQLEAIQRRDARPSVPDIWRALRAPGLWPVWWATLLFAALFSVFLFFGAVAAESRGVAHPTWFWFSYAGGAVAVRVLGARIPDRVGPRNVLAPALASYGIGLSLGLWAWTTTDFLVAGLFAGIGHGLFFPCAAALAIGRMPEALRGTALSAFSMLLELASLLAAPAFGLIADHHGDGWMFAAASVLCLTGLVGWALLEGLWGDDVPSAQHRVSQDRNK